MSSLDAFRNLSKTDKAEWLISKYRSADVKDFHDEELLCFMYYLRLKYKNSILSFLNYGLSSFVSHFEMESEESEIAYRAVVFELTQRIDDPISKLEHLLDCPHGYCFPNEVAKVAFLAPSVPEDVLTSRVDAESLNSDDFVLDAVEALLERSDTSDQALRKIVVAWKEWTCNIEKKVGMDVREWKWILANRDAEHNDLDYQLDFRLDHLTRVIKHHNVKDATLRKIVQFYEEKLSLAIAESSKTRAGTLEQLINSSSTEVRAAVAAHPLAYKMKVGLRGILEQDETPEVRQALLANATYITKRGIRHLRETKSEGEDWGFFV